MIDTNALEWKLRKLGESLDMLRHSMYLNHMKPMHETVGRSQRPWRYPKLPRRHQFYNCPQPCEKQHCAYCEGGLAFCVICRKGECELEEFCNG